MCEGLVGVDGLVAVAGPLLSAGSRIPREALLAADAALAAEARGEGPDAAPPMGADLLRVQAQAWSIALDQDGAEPRERMTAHKRSFTLGAPTDWGVPCRGNLMPEVAAQLQMIFDAHSNPAYHGVRFAEDAPADGEPDDAMIPRDTRTRAQQQHDALASALSVAASSGLLPTIGGAAPTLVVSVREEDAERGTGYAHAQGCDMPLGMAAALHVGCAGTIQRITSRDDGRIVRIGIEERVFNRHQRRAIALRDGGCIIPGCGIPAGWCEIHHVLEHVNGGPDAHRQRGAALLVPSQIHRLLRLEDPDEPRRPRSTRPRLVRRHPPMAPRHHLEDQTPGRRPPADEARADASGVGPNSRRRVSPIPRPRPDPHPSHAAGGCSGLPRSGLGTLGSSRGGARQQGLSARRGRRAGR